jgi:hypothetical protein
VIVLDDLAVPLQPVERLEKEQPRELRDSV